jgi:tetratricopeptide (TPR) repeat protein
VPRPALPGAVVVFMPHCLWHSGTMRFAFAILMCCLIAVPAIADDKAAQDHSSTSVAVGPVTKLTDAEKRANELDHLFAELHQSKLSDADTTEQKIWTLWKHNDSPTAELLLTQATAAMNDRAFDTSETMLDTLLDSYPDYLEALNKRATLYFDLKRYDDALADINVVLAAEPRHFGALAARGFIFSAQKKYGPAVDAFREALSINPNMMGVHAALKQLEHDYPDI